MSVQIIREYIIDSIKWVLESSKIENLTLEDDIITLEDNLNVENLNQLIKTYENEVIKNTLGRPYSIILWICLRLLQYEDLDLDKKYTPQCFKEYKLEEDEWSDFCNKESRVLYWGNFFGKFNKKQYVLIKFDDDLIRLKDYFSYGSTNELVMEEEAYFWLIDLVKTIENTNHKFFMCTDLFEDSKADNKTKVKASIKLALLSRGEVFHPIYEYPQKPLEDIIHSSIYNCFDLFNPHDTPYEQIDQLFNVLNEYNGSRGVIEKYLKLYQVFEELMIRLDVVSFSNNGKVKTARDFKEFKDVTGKNEKNSLNNLIQKLLLINSPTDDSIDLDLIKGIEFLWNRCISNFKSQMEREYMEAEKSNNNSNFFNLSQSLVEIRNNINNNQTKNIKAVSSFLSFIIYKLRNRIVHNKATENHITYVNLKGDIGVHLEKFFIPALELLAFSVIIRFPDCLRYSNQELTIKLY